jgi:hypothetical protein
MRTSNRLLIAMSAFGDQLPASIIVGMLAMIIFAAASVSI